MTNIAQFYVAFNSMNEGPGVGKFIETESTAEWWARWLAPERLGPAWLQERPSKREKRWQEGLKERGKGKAKR